MADLKMRFELIPVSKINPAKYNPRKDLKPGDTEYESIKVSIKTHGMVDPLVWNDHNGVLIGGHQRFKILKQEFKAKEVWCSIRTITDEKQEMALNVALNRSQGAWDPSKLQGLLTQFSDDDPDSPFRLSMGFTNFQFDSVLAGKFNLIDRDPQPLKAGLTDPDAVPDVPKKPITKRGDIWVLGRHLLVCGDSTQRADVDKALRGAYPVLINTDPPYGVDYATLVKSRGGQKKGGWKDIENDALDNQALFDLVDKALSMVPAPYLYLWHPSSRFEIFNNAVINNGWMPRQQIIWVKNNLVFGRADYHWRHEPCIYAKRKGAKSFEDRTQTTVWMVDKTLDARHPTQKPVELFAIPIRNHTEPGDAVYEPFSGSGSQLIAAEGLDRVCHAIELDPGYCDVAVERWQEFSGRKAKRA